MVQTETNQQTGSSVENTAVIIIERFETLVNNLTAKISELEQLLSTQNLEFDKRLAAQNHELTYLKQQTSKQLPNSLETIPSQISTSSRRKLLKRLGVTAAGITAASAAAITTANPSPAKAADGDFLLLGNSNIASNTTYLTQTTNATPGQKAILWADWANNGASATPTVNAGLAGTAVDTNAVGGFFQGGQAPILLAPSGSAGKPTANTHQKGEIYVDSLGVLYTCIVSGSPGTWVKPGINIFPNISGGSAGYFRCDNNTPVSVTGTSSTPSLYSNIVVTGTLAVPNQVPAGASAIYAAIQVIPTANTPRLYIYPSDGNDRTNFSNYTAPTMNDLNTHYQIVPISAAGKVNLRTFFIGTFYLDVYGYIF